MISLQIENASSLESLNHALEDKSIQSVLVAQGAKPLSSSLEEKGKFVKLITHFLLLDSTRYVFEDLQKGMHTMGLLDCIKEHPRQFEEIFCAQEHPLDANMIDLLFTVDYAEEGTRAREKQERAVVFWRDYLQDCGGIKYLAFEGVNFITAISSSFAFILTTTTFHKMHRVKYSHRARNMNTKSMPNKYRNQYKTNTRM